MALVTHLCVDDAGRTFCAVRIYAFYAMQPICLSSMPE